LTTPAETAITRRTVKTPSAPKSFPARIVRFADADTVILLIDLGFGVRIERPVRLTAIESWELDSPDGARALLARDQLNQRYATLPVRLIAHTRGPDRFGRIRGDVLLDGKLLSAHIVTLGLAWPSKRSAADAQTAENPTGHTTHSKTSHDVAPESTISESNVC
jgi:hypothetical protein